MLPTLRDGDWLFFLRSSRVPAPGALVIVADPADDERWFVKRVRAVRGATLDLAGDNPGHDVVVGVDRVVGRPFFRYWPPRRIGPL